jgi:hypothetical protein
MQDMAAAENARSLAQSGVRALQAGDAATARSQLGRAVELDPKDLGAWLNLAAACRAQSDYEAALGALDGALKLEPRNFLALLGKANVLERQGRVREAANAYAIALIQAPPDARLDPATLSAVRRARQISQKHLAELEDFVRSELAEAMSQARTSDAQRARIFVDLTIGRRQNYRQEPSDFFYPGLPAIEFYERDEFPWLPEYEAATEAIREELVKALAEDAEGFVPYIDYSDSLPLDQWAELNKNSRWSAYHLIVQGRTVEETARRCPATMEAISKLPQPQLPGRCPAAMFSALQPHTRIPPHTGVANFRVVSHLPLIIPPACGFRVGNETREWKPGEAWVFDDTINHEAWNESGQVRAILICDVWSPRLSPDERELIAAALTAMDRFNKTEPTGMGAL